MRRITKLLFVLADAFAWLLLAFSLAGVALFPFVGPIQARMAQQPLTTLGIIGTCAIWLIAAAGAYAITRRKVAGLFLVLAPTVAPAVSGQLAFALAYAVTAVVVFVTPFLLTFLQACSTAASRPAA